MVLLANLFSVKYLFLNWNYYWALPKICYLFILPWVSKINLHLLFSLFCHYGSCVLYLVHFLRDCYLLSLMCLLFFSLSSIDCRLSVRSSHFISWFDFFLSSTSIYPSCLWVFFILCLMLSPHVYDSPVLVLFSSPSLHHSFPSPFSFIRVYLSSLSPSIPLQ